MAMTELLALVPGLPLAGVVALVLGGRWLSDRAAAWLATLAVGLAFVLAVAIGMEYHARPGEEGARPTPVVQRLWGWISAGEELVEVTIAARELPPLAEIPAEAVGQVWLSADTPGLAEVLERMWDPQAVVGLRPMGQEAVPAGQVLTSLNVPPPEGRMVLATARRQHRFAVDMALQLDGLSLVMMLLVTGVGFLIHLYAMGYMRGDPGVRRFFVYLNLFVASMLVLVLGANLLVLFIGWELVGLCSYLLIGFWYADPANADAGRKAFIVNRVGDLAFLVGLMLVWSVFGSLAYGDLFRQAVDLLPSGSLLPTAIGLLLLLGATGKSAQVPLYVWLPDAMAGPTPVSALIHAATMVTAGVYMIARLHPLYEQAPAVMALVAALGAATALLAALMALVEVDLKRVLAYSTISQLGYMFLAVGAGAYVAGLFHLVTHAFFKALLFLAAGSVMHALAHGLEAAGSQPDLAAEDGVPVRQDLRCMGGLQNRLPLAAWTLVIGGLSLAGVFPLAGFWSKDEILLELAVRDPGPYGWLWPLLWLVGLATAFLTALYVGRLLLLALGGRPRSAAAERVGRYRDPVPMAVALVALALLTVAGGLMGTAVGGRQSVLSQLLGPVVGSPGEVAGPARLQAAQLATAVALSGLAFAWLAYGPRPMLAPRVARLQWLYSAARDGFYADRLYLTLVVVPYRRLAVVLWRTVDDRLIDGAVNTLGRRLARLAQWSRTYQTGYVRRYAASMVAGALVLVLYLYWALR